jgi:hypothetical protein
LTPLANQLPFKSHSEPHIERQVEQLRLQEVYIRYPTSKLEVLVRQANLGAIEYVEEVSDEVELHLLIDPPRIVRVHIKAKVRAGPSQRAAPAHRNLTSIEVSRMRKQVADRHACLKVKAWAKVQTTKAAAVLRLAEFIAAEDVDDVEPIRVQWTRSKLIAEQSERASGKVEERADTWISLADVITEVAFLVTIKPGDGPIAEQLPIV